MFVSCFCLCFFVCFPFLCLLITVKLRKWAPGVIFFKGPFWGLIFGGAYIRRGLCTEGNLRFVLLCIRGKIPSTSPPGDLYYSGTPPYDHPVYKTTSLLRPYSFKPNVKTIDSFYYFEDPVNATTSLLRPGFYGPNGGRINGVPL